MDLKSPATLEPISNSTIQPSVPRPLKTLYRGEPMALGITQIGIGIMEIAFGLVITMTEQINKFEYGEAHLATPYWTGILVKGMLGMNVVSAMAAGVAIAIVTISLIFTSHLSPCDGSYDSNTPIMCQESTRVLSVQLHYVSTVLVLFTALEFLIAIVTASFGCASLCRSTYSETTVVIFQNTAQGTPPAVLTPVKEDEVP
ncbi:PREDICTED: membrane-spanning 4-domains subfamily A member 15-like [Gekko japonicus]|uniref:Membrane-spanning 4-domains subfamily A member 15-like n=1 Tax=Gekko japonicus TaxID=146911 RepID=A0ABM1JWA4_GEKJA|nr:PREDICTED: membrane-spanning 4-domains subfamily A member 15-like [Gekko japonicus]